ncbi:TPA: hypothetical protein MFG03_005368 [Klebsiella pneumoniae]|nr:hypothetical protein [Klebsiella pneumoniae]
MSVLKHSEAGKPVELCRKHGLSNSSFYKGL